MAAQKQDNRRAKVPGEPKSTRQPTEAGDQSDVLRLAAIVENSADAVFSKDLDGTIRSWNRGAERLYGYTRDEAVGQSVAMLIPADRAGEFAQIMSRLRSGENIEQLETGRIRKDGQRVCVSLTASPVRDGNGKVVSASVISRDITERKRAEEALRRSEERFRLLADAAPVMIWMSGTDKSCTWFNKPWLDFVGRPIQQELGNGWTENIHADDSDRCLQTYNAAFDTRQPFSMEYRLRRYDGKYRWLLDNGVPLYGSDGGFTGYIGSCIDITERREAEESVAATYRQLKFAMSAARMAAWTWDPRNDVASNLENFSEIYGLASVNGIENGMALVHPEDRSRHRETIARAVERGTSYHSLFRIIRPDNGQIVWLDERAVPVLDRGGRITTLSGVVVDVTERKQAEQDILAREELLQAILDTAMDAIITIDQRGIIQSVNAVTERMFGYTAAEMIGQNVSMLMASPDREAHDGYIARYLETGERHVLGISREVDGRRKDGSIFPTDLAVSEIKHLELFTGIHRDLTHHKQLERDVVEVASLEQRRIGQDLHDSVAQELTALNLLARDLAETLRTDPEKALSLVERMQQGLQRSQQELRVVLRGLLPVAVDAEGLMSALADLAGRTQHEGKVHCEFDCPEAVSVADNFTATHLYLIAQEAVYNAVKHAQARTVRITLSADGGLILSVQDDGVGMPVQEAENLGLGLRIMRNRASIIGARLTIEPARPTGTLVTCVLVRRNNEPARDREARPRPSRG
jgi:PAS domain S-box-containing protein